MVSPGGGIRHITQHAGSVQSDFPHMTFPRNPTKFLAHSWNSPSLVSGVNTVFSLDCFLDLKLRAGEDMLNVCAPFTI
jgi:hypothetical protein